MNDKGPEHLGVLGR